MNQKNLILFIGGLFFGFGLAFGGMSKPEIVLSFLQLRDYGLTILMGAGAVVAFIAIQIVPRILGNPVLGGEFKPRERKFTRNTVIGAVIFGIGWGFSGLCPGSSISSLGTGNYPAIIGIISMFVGAYTMGRFFG